MSNVKKMNARRIEIIKNQHGKAKSLITEREIFYPWILVDGDGDPLNIEELTDDQVLDAYTKYVAKNEGGSNE